MLRPVSYLVDYNNGKMELMPVVVVVTGRFLLSCGHLAFKVHKRLMSSLITLQ